MGVQGVMEGALVPAGRLWEDPSVIGINKRRAHVPLRSHTAPEQALRHYALRSGAPACLLAAVQMPPLARRCRRRRCPPLLALASLPLPAHPQRRRPAPAS